jgi:type II secretory pathway component PulF
MLVSGATMIGTSDARRAALYQKLASLEEAGIPLRTAVDRVQDSDLRPVASALDQGVGPAEAWAAAGRFTPLEVTLVGAGAKSGQLAHTFQNLAKIFEDTANTKRALVLGLAYPFILVHLVIFVPTLYLLITKGVGAYAEATLIPLAVVYGVAFAIYFFGRTFAQASPAAAGALLQAVPLLGGYLKKKALAHGLGTLAIVYRAGVPVNVALEGAAQAATLFSVREGFRRIRQRLDDGAPIGEAFEAETTFPSEVREAASTGAITGKLDEQLEHARRRLDAEANQRRGIILVIIPIVALLAVGGVVGLRVVSMWNEVVIGPLQRAMDDK